MLLSVPSYYLLCYQIVQQFLPKTRSHTELFSTFHLTAQSSTPVGVPTFTFVMSDHTGLKVDVIDNYKSSQPGVNLLLVCKVYPDKNLT